MSLTGVDSSVRPADQVPKPKVKDPNCSKLTSSATLHSPEDRYHDLDETAQHRQSDMNIRDIFQRNTGLFLIIMAQCCGSSMTVAVKLNSLDIPVPTMEVCVISLY